MDATNFLKQIRSIIREEIEYALDKKLNESRKKDDREVISHGMKLINNVGGKPAKKPAVKHSNEELSSIKSLLEQTRRSMEESMRLDENENSFDGEFHYSTDSVGSFMSNRNNVGAIPDGINPSELEPTLKKALTRNYSSLIKKIEEKKTGR